MTCHVYDVNDYKLLTTFDDQHFGLYYQYNAEGKLIRKIIETEKGMKTVQETQYNTPKN
jgi:YD repeat-containing protein